MQKKREGGKRRFKRNKGKYERMTGTFGFSDPATARVKKFVIVCDGIRRVYRVWRNEEPQRTQKIKHYLESVRGERLSWFHTGGAEKELGRV